nr:cyclin-dependent kinase 2-associated protein 1 isoform X1 [Odocoileus virginianus texanus]
MRWRPAAMPRQALLPTEGKRVGGTGNSQVPQSKYAELLAIIEELGKEIRPTYAGSKSAMERLKRGIIHARGLVRECLAETERNARS